MVSDGTLKLIFVLILIVLGITLGFVIAGPILAAWTLMRGWINTSWLAKAGAIVLPLIGIGMGFDLYIVDGEDLTILGNLLAAAWLVAIQPILAYILLGIAYSRRDALM